MKIKIVYYIFLVPGRWEQFIDEQIGGLKKLKLYEMANQIFISCSGDKKEFFNLEKKIESEYKKIKITNYDEENVYEYPGFKTIYEIVEEDTLILYFHSKGIISGQKNDDNNRIRKMLFHYVIKEYELYIERFKQESDLKIVTMYPGIDNTTWYNFFWVRSDLILQKQIDIVKSENRYVWERWFSQFNQIKTYSPILNYEKIKDRNFMYNKNKELFKTLNL